MGRRHPHHGRTRTVKITRGRWAGWSIDTDTRLLVYTDVYPVGLERLLSTGQVLDIGFQVAQKAWATTEVVGGYYEAVAELWGGPVNAQYALAPSGIPRTHGEHVLDRLLDDLREKWLAGG
jgi:hypothetical protein